GCCHRLGADGRYEAIAVSAHRLDECGARQCVAERDPDVADGNLDDPARDERVTPHRVEDLIGRHDLPASQGETTKHCEVSRPESDRPPVAPESTGWAELVGAEEQPQVRHEERSDPRPAVRARRLRTKRSATRCGTEHRTRPISR